LACAIEIDKPWLDKEQLWQNRLLQLGMDECP